MEAPQSALEAFLIVIAALAPILLLVAPFVRMPSPYQTLLVALTVIMGVITAWYPLSGPLGWRLLLLLQALAIAWWVMQRRAGPNK